MTDDQKARTEKIAMRFAKLVDSDEELAKDVRHQQLRLFYLCQRWQMDMPMTKECLEIMYGKHVPVHDVDHLEQTLQLGRSLLKSKKLFLQSVVDFRV